MRKFTVLSLLLSFAFLFLLYSYKSGLLYTFSKQGNLNMQNLSGSFDPNGNFAVFNNKSIVVPFSTLAYQYRPAKVLGESNSPKRIEVDLGKQRLYAYEGNNLVYNFLISSGLWGRTPTGVFKIWIKLRYTKMEGGSTALGTYYNLPNVPYVMFFYNDEVPKYKGFSLHGTYWHSNFGHPMSHGCVNMKTEEVAQLYYWAHPELPPDKQSVTATPENPGTEVIIYGDAPLS